MLNRATTIIVYICFALTSAPTFAQTAVTKAKVLHDEGVLLFKAKKFPEARDKFDEAYKLDPAPLLLYNLARSCEEMGDADCAVAKFALYLERWPDANDAEDVRRRARVLNAVVKREREAKAREAAKKKPPPDSEKKPSVTVVREVNPEPGPNLAPWGWGAAGVGLAGIGAGLYFLSEKGSQEDAHAKATTGADKKSTADAAESAALNADIAFIAGAVLVATGVTFLVVDAVGETEVQVVPTGNGAAAIIRF